MVAPDLASPPGLVGLGPSTTAVNPVRQVVIIGLVSRQLEFDVSFHPHPDLPPRWGKVGMGVEHACQTMIPS